MLLYIDCCDWPTDENDINGFDYQRYHMEAIDLREIVENPDASLVRLFLVLFSMI
jgi:hypothetical protein